MSKPEYRKGGAEGSGFVWSCPSCRQAAEIWTSLCPRHQLSPQALPMMSFHSQKVVCAWTCAGIIVCFNTVLWHWTRVDPFEENVSTFLWVWPGAEVVSYMRYDNILQVWRFHALRSSSSCQYYWVSCAFTSGSVCFSVWRTGTRCECYKNSVMVSLFSYAGDLVSLEFKCKFSVNQPCECFLLKCI